MISMLVAAAIAANPWITYDDYPPKALREHREGLVTAELTFDPTGQLINCGVANSSGSRDLDDATCALVRKRVRRSPASFEGQPVGYVFRLRFNWTIGTAHSVPPPDSELNVSLATLPPDVARLSASLEFVVASDGHIESCHVPDGEGSGSPALDKAVCASMAKSETFPSLRDRDGRPMRYLRVQKVAFTTEALR